MKIQAGNAIRSNPKSEPAKQYDATVSAVVILKEKPRTSEAWIFMSKLASIAKLYAAIV